VYDGGQGIGDRAWGDREGSGEEVGKEGGGSGVAGAAQSVAAGDDRVGGEWGDISG